MFWKTWKPAPLSSSFMLTAMLGFIISAVWILPQSLNWGITFLLFFSMMFIASVISTTQAPVEQLESLEKKRRKKKR